MKQLIIGTIISFLIAILIFLIWKLCIPNKPQYPYETQETEITIDTIYIPRNIEPIKIIGTGKLKHININSAKEATNKQYAPTELYIPDSLLQIPNFVSMFDTIYNKDTFRLQYEFPQNIFSLSMQPQTDSIMFKQIIVKENKEKWWLKPAIATGSAVIGVLVGIVIAK